MSDAGCAGSARHRVCAELKCTALCRLVSRLLKSEGAAPPAAKLLANQRATCGAAALVPLIRAWLPVPTPPTGTPGRVWAASVTATTWGC